MNNKLKLTSWALLLALLVSCSTQNDSVEAIADLERELYSNAKSVFDPQIAENLVSHYEAFVVEYPQDSLAPFYLFKGAEVAMGMGSSDKAIELYGRVYGEFPDFPKASTSLFLIGFVNETQKKNLAEAQKYYRRFIAEFPKHNLINDAQFSLDNLGKSDEEIIKEFEAKLANPNQDSL